MAPVQISESYSVDYITATGMLQFTWHSAGMEEPIIFTHSPVVIDFLEFNETTDTYGKVLDTYYNTISKKVHIRTISPNFDFLCLEVQNPDGTFNSGSSGCMAMSYQEWQATINYILSLETIFINDPDRHILLITARE